MIHFVFKIHEKKKGTTYTLELATGQTGLGERFIRALPEKDFRLDTIWANPNPRLHANPLLPSLFGMYLITSIHSLDL